MSLPSWYRRNRGNSKSAQRQRRSASLLLEKLEERAVPALSYHGGPLLGNVQIEAVYYAPWNSSGTLQSQRATLDSFFPFITNSSFMDLLAPYSAGGTTIGHGSFLGDDSNFPTALTTTVSINGNNYPAIDNNQIRADLSAQINAGGNNLTTPNANTLYFVFTPPGTVVTAGSENSVKNFVGFHSWFHDPTSGQDVVYAVMPYPDGNPNAGFFPLNTVQVLEQTATHELAEAVTDALPGGSRVPGWYDDALGYTGEIGDLCNAEWGTLNGYVVQNLFSNASNSSAIAAGSNFYISSLGNPAEGQFSGPIATFVDTSGSGVLSSAAVDWGDGTYVYVPTTVQRVNSTTFHLIASHTYNADEGAVFNPKVFLTLADGSQANARGVLDIQDGAGNDYVYMDKGLVTLADPPVTGTAVNVSGRANASFNAAVATFTDPSGAESTSNYTALIDWGDGTSAVQGLITQTGGIFTVKGGHTYNQPGSFAITVTIQHDSAPSTTLSSTANIGAVGTQIVWSGASGVDLNWSDAKNWVGNVVPGPGDIAVFNNTANNGNSVVDPGFAGTIGGVILDSTWGATLTIQNTLTITGSSSWASGFINGGTAGLVNTGTLTVTGPSNKYLGGLLTNNGTILHGYGPGSLGFNGDATLVNNGTYDFQADGTGIFINSGPAATFINNGTLKKSAITDSDDRSFLHVSFFTNNGGSIDVERGRLALGQAAVTSTGMTITVAATDAVFDLTDNTTVTYTGNYGPGFGEGHIRLLNGTLAVGLTGATFNFPQPDVFEWKGGFLSAGKAGLSNAGSMTVTGANNKYLGGLLTNNGTILHGYGPGSLGFNGDATLVNNGTYDFQADGTGIFINSGPAATFINNGVLKKSAVTDSGDRSFLHVSVFNNNGGSIDVEQGRLALGQATVTSTGMTITVAATDAVFDLTDNTTVSYAGNFGNGSGNGHIQLLNGTLAIGAGGATFSFPQAGLFQWKGGFLSAGLAGLTNTGSMTVTGANNKYLGGLLTNNGTILHGYGPGSLGFNGDATLVNNGTYDFQADGTGIFINSGPAATFINNGTLKKSAVTDSDDRSFLHVSFFTNNGGTFDVERGRLALGQATVTSTGTSIIVAGSDAVLDLTDNTTVTLTGNYGNGFGNGRVRLLNGTLAVGAAGATFNFLQTGLFEWKGGFLSAGSTGLTNSGSLTVTGANNKYLSGLLTNNGTIIQGFGPGSLGFNGDATLVNNGTYDFQDDSTGIFVNSGPAATFINNGTVEKSQGSLAASISVTIFTNQSGGTVSAQSGTLNLAIGGSSTGNFNAGPASAGATINFTGGTYTANPGTSFTGDGLLQVGGGTLIINGVVGAQNVAVVNGTLKLNSDAILYVASNYMQSGGALAIDLGGTSPGAGFGQLNIAGTASLGGTLSVALVNSYFPSAGSQFQLLTFGSHVKSFGSINGLNLGNGVTLSPALTDNSLTLVTRVPPAPPPGPGANFPGKGPVSVPNAVQVDAWFELLRDGPGNAFC
ncbi:MAG TPA: hypothetical protein VKU02_09850 [Gemmataceae bacterium]|nr:hypothetical protein [Gemmataceae bacterium]